MQVCRVKPRDVQAPSCPAPPAPIVIVSGATAWANPSICAWVSSTIWFAVALTVSGSADPPESAEPLSTVPSMIEAIGPSLASWPVERAVVDRSASGPTSHAREREAGLRMAAGESDMNTSGFIK